MNADTASRTALAVALMRSLHARADPHRILDDPWGDRLVPAPVRTLVYQKARSRDAGLPALPDETTLRAGVDAYLRGHPAYANVILRSRYAEDLLKQALARGVRQYVLIGAGFDSYALRRPAEAAELVVIEIDHPATQSLKRQCIAAAGAGAASPDPVHFIAADLAAEDLSAVLRRSALRSAEPAFFSWLGVTMYLSREANRATLRAIAATAAPGSEIVFSYIDQAVFDAPPTGLPAAVLALRRDVAALGEPFVSGFAPGTLEAELQAFGYRLLEDCADAELLRRYDPDGANRLVARGTSRVAHARITGGPAA